MHSDLASVQAFTVYASKYGVICTEAGPECTWFCYHRKGLLESESCSKQYVKFSR